MTEVKQRLCSGCGIEIGKYSRKCIACLQAEQDAHDTMLESKYSQASRNGTLKAEPKAAVTDITEEGMLAEEAKEEYARARRLFLRTLYHKAIKHSVEQSEGKTMLMDYMCDEDSIKEPPLPFRGILAYSQGHIPKKRQPTSQFALLTVNPDSDNPDFNLAGFLVQVDKALKRTMFENCKYGFEYRFNPEAKGTGLHMHALVKFKDPKQSLGEAHTNIYNTFKKFCATERHVDLKPVTPGTENTTLEYVTKGMKDARQVAQLKKDHIYPTGAHSFHYLEGKAKKAK